MSGKVRVCLIQCACMCARSLQPCLTLFNPMDCSPPGSSVHGILQARILKWVANSFSTDLPDPGIKPRSLMSPALAGGLFTTSATWEVAVSSIRGANASGIIGYPFLLPREEGQPAARTHAARLQLQRRNVSVLPQVFFHAKHLEQAPYVGRWRSHRCSERTLLLTRMIARCAFLRNITWSQWP